MTLKKVYEQEKRKDADMKRKYCNNASGFIRMIAEKTCKSETTVRMWLSGRQTPDELTKQVIADTIGVKANELFPQN